jgi:uncharacterized damage-inducible protein DinB
MTDALRDHLARALDWQEAHATFDKAVADFPGGQRGAVPPGFDHSAWQLLEHIRLAQDDLLDFCVNSRYVHTLKWPDDYWPKDAAPPDAKAWTDAIAAYKRRLDEFKRVVRDTGDLAAAVPTGKPSQTYLREILLLLDHTAYHVGQIVAVRRALGIWPG